MGNLQYTPPASDDAPSHAPYARSRKVDALRTQAQLEADAAQAARERAAAPVAPVPFSDDEIKAKIETRLLEALMSLDDAAATSAARTLMQLRGLDKRPDANVDDLARFAARMAEAKEQAEAHRAKESARIVTMPEPDQDNPEPNPLQDDAR